MVARRFSTVFISTMLAFAALLVFVLALSSAKVSAEESYSFEFYNFQTNAYTTAFPFGHTNEVIVASQSQDVRNQLPIHLSFKIDGKEEWSATIPNNPSQNCRGATGCSTRGPSINDPGSNSYVELAAHNPSGQTLAAYTRGTPPAAAAETTETDQQTSQSPSTGTQSGSISTTDNWFRRWWLAGFWVGVLWLFPWIFVGRQWARLKFWGFGWPWPWWFWIPFVWFIPWLIFAWIWWLDWWVWWVWIWWLFPWIFWLFWWVVLFKESNIWLWRQKK